MNVFTMGKIQIERYQVIVPTLNTDMVIITSERIDHINKHHPGNWDAYGQEFIPKMLENPEYILEDRDRPNDTAILLKSFPTDSTELFFHLVLRLHTPEDPPEYLNSIMTFWRIRQKEYKRMVKNRNHY